jgi:peptide/nickel transport system permease protein
MRTEDAAPPAAPARPGGSPLSPRQLRRARRRQTTRRFWHQYRRSAMGMAGLVIMLFFIAMAIFSIFASKARLDPTLTTGQPLNANPSWRFPFGTNGEGISVLSLVIEGSRVSLFVGFAASVISMVVGSGIGIYAGYIGRAVDAFLMFVTNAFLVLPWLALAIVLAAIFGQNIWVIIFIIGLTSWPGTARLVRAQVLSVKERLYVERSKGLGGSNWHVVSRHILPNVMPVIFANTILTVAIAILSESALSFLGLGDPTRITWGTTIEDAFSSGALTNGHWVWLMAPSLCIVLVVLAFTMVGFAFDEIVNPRIRER